jgi:hypothetical protein
VQVHYDEGVAIHSGPEPCVGVRKDADAGARARTVTVTQPRAKRCAGKVLPDFAEMHDSASGASRRSAAQHSGLGARIRKIQNN